MLKGRGEQQVLFVSHGISLYPLWYDNAINEPVSNFLRVHSVDHSNVIFNL